MILRREIADGVAAGTVTCAFRRWQEARVRPGDRFMSVAGVIVVDEVTVVDPGSITREHADAAGYPDVEAVLASLRGDASDPVYRVALSWGGPDPRTALANQARLTVADVAEISVALDRIDARSRRGPWTRPLLELIASRPAVRAVDLAAALDRDRDTVKTDVRRLKKLGLTLSLDTGYRLSPRGSAYRDITLRE